VAEELVGPQESAISAERDYKVLGQLRVVKGDQRANDIKVVVHVDFLHVHHCPLQTELLDASLERVEDVEVLVGVFELVNEGEPVDVGTALRLVCVDFAEVHWF